MTKTRITKIETKTPQIVARVVNSEDDRNWWIECDGDCGRVNSPGKSYSRPVDYSNPDAGWVEVRLTAPPAWRCSVCGPF